MIYRITLFNTTHMCDMVTFNYPILPNIDDTIEVYKNDYFIIQNRIISSWVDDKLAILTLFGAMQNQDSYTDFRFYQLLKYLKTDESYQFLNLI